MTEEWSVIHTSLHDMWSGGSTLLEEGQQKIYIPEALHTSKTRKMNLKVSFLLT
jgi:hypothetical protein